MAEVLISNRAAAEAIDDHGPIHRTDLVIFLLVGLPRC
jgi:hypothetical protein